MSPKKTRQKGSGSVGGWFTREAVQAQSPLSSDTGTEPAHPTPRKLVPATGRRSLRSPHHEPRNARPPDRQAPPRSAEPAAANARKSPRQHSHPCPERRAVTRARRRPSASTPQNRTADRSQEIRPVGPKTQADPPRHTPQQTHTRDATHFSQRRQFHKPLLSHF